MELENKIATKMALLQELFKSTRAFVDEGHGLPEIVQFINERTNEEFISIAYEAAAMSLALQDLEKGTKLDTWQMFLDDYAKEHMVQVYVGLGWASAQKRLSPTIWIQDSDPLSAWRIWDGYGYYDGFFRRRKVLQGALPENISGKELSVYWQGVGRSFWYTCKGKRAQLQKTITKIPSVYQADFWRGIGIASTYVGGLGLMDCQELWKMADIYQPQLAAGTALAIKSRFAANTIVTDTELMATEWCKLPILKIVDILKNEALDSRAVNAASYHAWVLKLDQTFSS
jgi:hypothetical protein